MFTTPKLLHGRLAHIVATLRFGEVVVVADAGLPVPTGVETIDLALAPDLPSVADVLRVLKAALVIDEVRVATEMSRVNPSRHALIRDLFGEVLKEVPHEQLEEQLRSARVVIQTGDCTPYGNAFVVGGLEFFDIGMAEEAATD